MPSGEADARLIAAAPDLLSTLKGLVEYVGGHDEYADVGLAGRCDQARAAIAKAEGAASRSPRTE